MPTAVSDEVRTREAEAPPAPGIPAADAKPATTPKAPSTSDAISGLLATYEKRVAPLEEMRASLAKKYELADQEARDATKRAATEGTALLKPAVEGVKAAAQYPQPPLPQMAGEPPQPDQKPKPFLEMRSRKEDIQGVIAGLGLIGQMVAARGAPAAGLAAFTGAMKGWAEGDKERADRDWRSYLKAVDTIRHQNTDALRMWEAGMKTHHGNVAAQTAYLAAATAEAGMLDRAALVAQQGAASLAHSIDTVNRELDRVDRHSDSIMKTLLMHEMKEIEMARQDRQFEERRRDRRDEFNERMADRKEARSAREAEARVNPYDDATLTGMARQFLEDGKYPPFGTRNQGGRAAFMKKVIDLTNEAGGVGDVNARRMARSGATKAYEDLAKREANVMSYAKAFDLGAERFIELSKKVDRTGSPVFNRWLLKIRGQYQGDAEVSNLEKQAETLALEYSRVISRSGQGNLAMQNHAREIMSTAQTHEQLERGIKEVLAYDVDFARKGFQSEKKELADLVKNVGGGETKGAPGGTIRVKRKGDGATGTIKESDFDAAKYERVGG